MTNVYTINPLADMEGVRVLKSALEGMLRGSAKPTDLVVLRQSKTGYHGVSEADITIEPIATVKTYHSEEDPKTTHMDYENPVREAIVKTIKENSDVTVSFTGSFMSVEVPTLQTTRFSPPPDQVSPSTANFASRVAQPSTGANISVNCYPTKRQLVRYLTSVGAKPYGRQETTDPNMNYEWKGSERQQYGTNSTESTMCFSSVYEFFEVTIQDAVGYLSSHLLRQPTELKFVRKSAIQSSTIYIVRNIPLEVNIVTDSEFFTRPVSKQRLLAIFDSLRYGLERQNSLVLSITSKFSPKKSHNSEFAYDFLPARFGTGSKTVTANGLETKHSTQLFLTPLWEPFARAASTKDRILAVVNLFNVYGLSMGYEDYDGTDEDYVEDRATFELPKHTVKQHSRSYNVTGMPKPNSQQTSGQRATSTNRDEGRGRGGYRGMRSRGGYDSSRGRGGRSTSANRGEGGSRGGYRDSSRGRGGGHDPSRGRGGRGRRD